MEKLKINQKLSKIVMPKDKTKLFIDWYKKDLYEEYTIPVVFDEGYFDVDISDFITVKRISLLELNKETFESQELLVKNIINDYGRVIVHYRILSEKMISMDFYSESTGNVFCRGKKFDLDMIKMYRTTRKVLGAIDKEEEPKDVDEDLTFDFPKARHLIVDSRRKMEEAEYKEVFNEFLQKVSSLCVYLLISAIWYLASIKDDRTYNELANASAVTRDNKRLPNPTRKSNDGVYVRNITKTVYDLGLAKNVTVEKLISRKRGWKISCEFQVRGHYRHYKSGKVVFIKPFEKGKGLEARNTAIKLNPKSL